ncbi:MAG TPA: gamma-glutamyltransferase [bacterium]|nr:gamma-glutamyltransferase [bacterium]
MISKVVACPEPPAAAVGVHVYERGGTALEAAVAAAFAQGVTLPLGCGLAGMAHILLARRTWPTPRFFNASVAVGSGGHPRVFEDAFVGRSERAGRFLVRGDQNQVGYRSIMVPGFVRGMDTVFRLAGGRIPWASLVGPAAALARDGFPVYPYLERYYTFEGADRPGYPDVVRKLAGDAGARARYLPEGRPPRAGETLRQPEYGRTLERVASGGAEEFYRGNVGRTIAADLAAHDAFVTAEDLDHYEVQEATPARTTFRDLVVYSSPPPGHGPVLLTMLNLVEPLDLGRMAWNGPDYVETVAWATRTAFADCMPYLTDPRFATVPLDWLLSKERVRDAPRERAAEGRGADTGSDGHTTHVSSADADGDLASITHSIGSIAGAGVMTGALGFLYNNFLGHFNPLRGYHNSIEAGKRMGGCSPTIVYRSGAPWIAIGSSGGSRLVSAVFQTLLNVVLFGMSLADAVASPRVHSEAGRKIYVEPALAGRVADALARRGYEIEVTGYMGCNQAVELTEQGLGAASDPRGGVGIGWSEDAGAGPIR